MSNWINIKDKLPAIRTEQVLATDGNQIVIARYILTYKSKYNWFISYDQEGEPVFLKNTTHWLPLPKLPEVL